MKHICAAALCGVGMMFAFFAPASAMTMAECSQKYSAAKADGSLAGRTWTAFRKVECAARTDTPMAVEEPGLNKAPPTSAIEAGSAAFEPALQPADTPVDAPRMTLKECGAQYQAAKKSGQLNGQGWLEFRSGQCGYSSTGAANAGTRKALPAQAAAVVLPASLSFPTTISGEFAGQTAAQQRMRTCLQSYHRNKSAGTLGAVRWIQAGGGYYSLCNKRLKAQS